MEVRILFSQCQLLVPSQEKFKNASATEINVPNRFHHYLVHPALTYENQYSDLYASLQSVSASTEAKI